ncbi:hypothetical protein [uncultured Sphingomonas sp.]|nr:hypothetical protein [uncultured Sphingomonas sp.]
MASMIVAVAHGRIRVVKQIRLTDATENIPVMANSDSDSPCD